MCEIAQISQMQIPEGDSDDEGEGEPPESSDDGSDEDTVESIVLPKRFCPYRFVPRPLCH